MRPSCISKLSWYYADAGCAELLVHVWKVWLLVFVGGNRAFPDWSFDGSSTGQAEGNNSDCILRPVRVVPDPIRGGDDVLVMCEVQPTPFCVCWGILVCWACFCMCIARVPSALHLASGTRESLTRPPHGASTLFLEGQRPSHPPFPPGYGLSAPSAHQAAFLLRCWTPRASPMSPTPARSWRPSSTTRSRRRHPCLALSR